MNTTSAFASLLDVLAKSAALVLIGTALLALLRETSAANRHTVSAAIFAALLLLPLTKFMPARWSFALEKAAAPAVSVRLPLIETVRAANSEISAQPADKVAQPAPRTPLVIPWKMIALAVWITGTALLLARRAIIALRLRGIVRGSFPIEDERLAARVRSLVNASGVRADVRGSERCPVPVVSGLVRPVVLLPVEAADWSDASISSAMRHELGHIRRRDCITRLLADVLCALYWVNPLVWFAARRMRLAQEQACDDLVLNSGARADEYAEQLVEVVRSLQSDRFTARHALAMAQPSTLETRVLAIVDTQRDRSARSVRGTFAGFAFVAAMLALCTAAQLRGADEKKPAPVANADAPLRKQIQIKAKFIEVTEGDPALADFLKAAGASATPTLAGVVPAEKADAALKDLAKGKGVDILSAPSLVTKSKQRANIEIVREFRYPKEWEKETGGEAWKPTAFDMKDVGVTFDVTPEVLDDGSISLKMTPQVVEFEGFLDLDGDASKIVGKPDAAKRAIDRVTALPPANAIPAGHRARPIFKTRKVSIEEKVGPGQIIVIGGFESPDAIGEAKGGGVEPKKQLVVLVTVHIVKPEEIPNGKPAEAGDAQNNPGGKTGTATESKPDGKGPDSITADEKTDIGRPRVGVRIETEPAIIPAAADGIAPKKTGAAAAAEKIIFPKVAFRDSPLREVVEFLVAKSKTLDPAGKGVNIVMKDPDKIAGVKITLELSNIPLSEVLHYVVSLAGLGLREDEFAIFIGQPPAAGDRAAEAENARGAKADTRWIFPKLDFRDAPVREVVEFLVAKSKTLEPAGAGANIILKDAEKIGDVRITLALADTPLAEVLRYVAALANCEVVREEFAFVIGPAGAAAKAVPASKNAARTEEVTLNALNAKAGVIHGPGAAMNKAGTIIFPKIDLRDATLTESVDFLRAKAKELDPDKRGVNLVLKPGGADAKITLSLANIPLAEALRYVAALANFEIVAEDAAIILQPAGKK